jgi:hypothetical protein
MYIVNSEIRGFIVKSTLLLNNIFINNFVCKNAILKFIKKLVKTKGPN